MLADHRWKAITNSSYLPMFPSYQMDLIASWILCAAKANKLISSTGFLYIKSGADVRDAKDHGDANDLYPVKMLSRIMNPLWC